MAWKPRLPADAWVDQQLRLEAGEWKPSSMQLRRPGGLPTSLAVDPQVGRVPARIGRHADARRTGPEAGGGGGCGRGAGAPAVLRGGAETGRTAVGAAVGFRFRPGGT